MDAGGGAASAGPPTAAPSAPSTPLALVSGVVAGGDLEGVAETAAQAIGRPVAILLPGLAPPVVRPDGGFDRELLDDLAGLAARVAFAGAAEPPPTGIDGAVAVLVDGAPAGLVATSSGEALGPPALAWLEAAAAAAAVAALVREAPARERRDAGRELIELLLGGETPTGDSVREAARRAGLDTGARVVAVCGAPPAAAPVPDSPRARARTDAAVFPPIPGGTIAALDDGRIFVLIAEKTGVETHSVTVRDALEAAGLRTGTSDPQRGPGGLRRAAIEAELLSDVAASEGELAAGNEDTLRLLTGVLLHDPGELERLREATVVPLRRYDERNETELLVTLRTFLARDGSTTETADALNFHRHTVGYRLARVQEVSGFSPYESDGRERLGLGLKADALLRAHARRRGRG